MNLRLGSNDAYIATAEGALHFELDHAVDFSEQSVILAQTNAVTGVD